MHFSNEWKWKLDSLDLIDIFSLLLITIASSFFSHEMDESFVSQHNNVSASFSSLWPDDGSLLFSVEKINYF